MTTMALAFYNVKIPHEVAAEYAIFDRYGIFFRAVDLWPVSAERVTFFFCNAEPAAAEPANRRDLRRQPSVDHHERLLFVSSLSSPCSLATSPRSPLLAFAGSRMAINTGVKPFFKKWDPVGL